MYVAIAKTDILCLRSRIEISLKEIQEKAPNRQEYIKPMSESIDQINWIYNVLESLDKDYRSARLRNYDLELINLKQIQEIQNLKKEIKLINDINESDL